MIVTHQNSAFIALVIVLLFSITIDCKSIDSHARRNQKPSQNEIQESKIEKKQLESVSEESNQIPTSEESTTQNKANQIAVDDEKGIHGDADLQPHNAKPVSENVTRNQRTIEIPPEHDPAIMIEQFRRKLKSARNHLEEMAHVPLKPVDPNIFIHDPNVVLHTDQNPPFEFENSMDNLHVAEGKSSTKQLVPNEEIPQFEDKNINEASSKNLPGFSKTEATSFQRTTTNTNPKVDPIGNIDQAEEEHQPNSSNKEEFPIETSSEQGFPPSEIKKQERDHLMLMKDEVNKLRGIMQVLKEHQMQQKSQEFFKKRNLTSEQQEELEGFVKKMKERGLISTSPFNPSPEFGRSQLEPFDQVTKENSEKLSQDVNSLKGVIVNLVKQIETEKINEENLNKLQEQLKAQQTEIENLRVLIDKVLPPIKVLSNSKSELIKHPDQSSEEKIRLLEELKLLQDLLTNLLARKKKEKLLKSTARENGDDTKLKLNEKSDEELQTLVKIFNTLVHPNENRQGKSMETKIDQLEKDLRELDNRNVRTRQEMLLEKLERDIKELKEPKIASDMEVEIKEKIKKLEEDIKMQHETKKQLTVDEKIAALEKQIKQLTPAQSRDIDSDPSIGIELEKLQKEIDKLNQKDGHLHIDENAKPNSDQVHSLLKELLLKPDETHFTSTPTENSRHENISPLSELTPSASVLTPKSYPESINHGNSPIFQLPFCLQHLHSGQSYNNPNIGPSNPIYPSANQNYLSATQHLQPYTNHQNNQQYANIPQLPTINPVHSQQCNTVGTIEHIYPPQSSPTLVHSLIYKPQSSLDQANKFNLNPAENFAYNKDLSQYTGNKPQMNHFYQQPSSSELPTQGSADSYDNENKNPDLQDEKSLYDSSTNIVEDNDKPYYLQETDNMADEITRLNGILGVLNDKISKQLPENQYRDSKMRKKRSIDAAGQDNSVENMQKRLASLKEQVEKFQENQIRSETKPEIAKESCEGNSPREAYDYGEYNEKVPGKLISSLKVKKAQKFDKLFIKIVKFILHKLEISAPHVVDSFFGGEDFDFAHDEENEVSGYGNDYNQDYTQKKYRASGDSFQNLLDGFSGFPGFNGLLGIIPTILFKSLSNFSSFVNILKRNNFFKNFLVPGLLILLVDGIMAMLVWWFSPQDEPKNISFIPENLLNKNKEMSLYKPS